MKIVIIGAGEVGFHIASRLALENKDVVVIDKNPDAIDRVSDHLDVQAVVGSGASPSALKEAGIQEAEIVLAVTDSDETNLVACLMADLISPATKKLARIRDRDFDEYHKLFRNECPHIDTIINPEVEVVKTIEGLMSVPGAVDVNDFADGRVKLIGVQLEADTLLSGIHLHEIPRKLQGQNLLIAAVARDEELIIPRGDDRLIPGDIVYFICEDKSLAETLSFFNIHFEPIRHAMIIGGGRIGLRLAKRLEQRAVNVKIIEKDVKRGEVLAEKLHKTLVLIGDGTDQRLLAEENIQNMDIVIPLTGDEENNILISLLAKRMGVKKSIVRISKFSYFPLMLAIGMRQAVSPRLSAINTILQHVRKGKVLSATSLRGEQAEVLEAVAMETSKIVGKPLMKLSLPKGMLITTIIRNDEVIIPLGKTVIEPGDRIIVFSTRQAVPKLEKILAVKLEYF